MGNADSTDAMIFYNNQAMQLAKKDSSKEAFAYSLFVRGKIELSYTKNYSAATERMLEAKSFYENINDSAGIAMCYNQLGLINYLLTIYKTAIENFDNSLNYNDTIDLQNAVAKYLIAISYAELDSTSKGKQYFDLAIQAYTKIGKLNKIKECYSYMAKMYVAANDLDAAAHYFDLLENGPDKISDEQTIGRVEAIKSGYYFKRNQLPIAIDFASRGFATGLKYGDEITCRLSSDILFKAYEIKGDFKQAFYYINYLKQLNDSFYNTNIAQRIAEITTNAKFDKKMMLEKQAEEKKSELARKEIEKQKVIRNSILAFLLIAISFLIFVFNQRRNLTKAKNQSEQLLLNILPASVAEELKISDHVHAMNFDSVSVLFTDFKDFAKMTTSLSAKDLVTEIDFYFSAFDKIISKYNIEKIKTIGDAYMCASGVPNPNSNHANDLVNAAFDIQQFIFETSKSRMAENKPFFQIRTGIHSGPVVAGVVGTTKFAYDIWGETVNIASRIEASGETGKINISGATYEIIKENYQCTYRGKIQIKNIGEIEMYFVDGLLK